MPDIFSTAELAGVIQVDFPIDPYWLNLAFPRVINFDTEVIMFDMVTADRRLAPFVAPNVQGRVMRERGRDTRTFKPAYVKPKHAVTPQRGIARRAGERPMGELSIADRWNLAVADNIQVERNSIIRRWDWMACRAVVDGSVLVQGEDYPPVTVDFGRDASLSVVLAGTARWGQSGANILGNLDMLRRAVFALAGTGINRLTFGLDAWDLFTADAKILDLLNTQKRGSDTEFNRVMGVGTPYEYRGVLSGGNGQGRLELYTYNDQYENENGVMTPYMDQLTVVGTGDGIQGVRCFGAIMDASSLQAVDMFPKMWDNQDPSVTYTMTQSAPLMVPAQPNACFKIKVA